MYSGTSCTKSFTSSPPEDATGPLYSGSSGCTNASPSFPSICVPFASNGRVYSGTSCTKSFTSSPPEDATGPVYSGRAGCTNASPSWPTSCVPFASIGRVYSGTSFTNAFTSSPPVDTTGFSTLADCVWTVFPTFVGCVGCTEVGFTVGCTGLVWDCSTLTGWVWVGLSTVFTGCVVSICFLGLTVSLGSWPGWTTGCVDWAFSFSSTGFCCCVCCFAPSAWFWLFSTVFFSWTLFSISFFSETSSFRSSLVKYPMYL